MSEQSALAGFTDKWRARWPEWRVAEVFVPAPQRAIAVAWFALRQELADAAWSGADPRPGEAKLGWWVEELHGWSQGRRRHPLGAVLQSRAVPWSLLATCVPALLVARERAADVDEAIEALEPYAEGIAGTAATLFGGNSPAPARSTVIGLLAEQLQVLGEGAVPLQVLAQANATGATGSNDAAMRAWARELLQRWPPPHAGARPGRIHAALLRERLHRFAGGNASSPTQALSRWTALWTAWCAARS